MAMKLYTRAEFEDELEKIWKLKKTPYKTNTTVAWVTRSGKHLLVPILENGVSYPDYFMDRVYQQLVALGELEPSKPPTAKK